MICRVMVRYGAEDVMIRKEKWARDEAEDKVIWGELWTVYGAEKNVLEKHTIKGGSILTKGKEKK